MKQFADIIAILFLSIIIIQDMKARQISGMLIPLLFFSLLSRALLNGNFSLLLNYFAFNFIFILVQFGFLFIYYALRNKKAVNIIDSHIGLGDLLLLPVLCLVFSPGNFILFYVTSLLLSLAGFILFRSIKKNTDHTLPLAGTISMCLVALMVVEFFTGINFYDDGLLLSFLKTQV